MYYLFMWVVISASPGQWQNQGVFESQQRCERAATQLRLQPSGKASSTAIFQCIPK